MRIFFRFLGMSLICLVMFVITPAIAQTPRVRLPSTGTGAPTPPTVLAPRSITVPQVLPPSAPAAQTAQVGTPGLTPVVPPSYPANTFSSQPFDPYAIGPGVGGAPAAVLGPPVMGPTVNAGVPPILPAPGAGAVNPYTAYPSPAYPPPANPLLAPGGFSSWWERHRQRWFGGGATGVAAVPAARPARLIYGPRFQHTWLYGSDSSREMDINDTDVSIALTWPNFLFSGQPLFMLPSFSLHVWDGPQGLPTSDLPANAYSAFGDFGWVSNPAAAVGAELGFRIGVFTDFNTLTTDSLRILGKGLFTVRMTPTTQLKAGVIYVDRADLKILPAGGILWTPNARTRFDVFFPKPKLAQYATTFGNFDVWWYLAGEFGGGSWTVERIARPPGIPAPYTDQVEISDIRLALGLEWGPDALIRAGRRIGFFEAGWVTDRDVTYVVRPQDSFTLRDTFMIRAGIGY